MYPTSWLHAIPFEDYTIEGHVPAGEVKRLLAEPKAQGIAVPGMPVGSPGMEQAEGCLCRHPVR